MAGRDSERVLRSPKSLEEVRVPVGSEGLTRLGLWRSGEFWGKGLGKRPWKKGDLSRGYPHYQHSQKSIHCSAELVPGLFTGMPRGEMSGALRPGEPFMEGAPVPQLVS